MIGGCVLLVHLWVRGTVCGGAWLGSGSGDVGRPGGHQIAALLEQVASPIGGFDTVAVDVRAGEFADLAGISVLSAAQSWKLERKPDGTAPLPSSRRSLDRVLSLSTRPVGDGKTSPLWSAISHASSRTATAGPERGTRCSSFAFMRVGGTVQVAAS